jgi:hypothetical protein
MSVTKLKSSYVSGGRVIARTDDAVYCYKYELNEYQFSRLLMLLGSADEINLEHWGLEWVESSTGVDVVKKD